VAVETQTVGLTTNSMVSDQVLHRGRSLH